MVTPEEIFSKPVDRRQFLRLAGGLGAIFFGTACGPQLPISPAPDATPTRLPTPTVPATLIPEPLDQQLLEKAGREMLDLSYYPLSIREILVNYWLRGLTGVDGYQRGNQAFSMAFKPATPDPTMDDFAITGISLDRTEIHTGGSVLLFSFRGRYYSRLGAGLPERIRQDLNRMNFQHEAIVSLAAALGLSIIGRQLGLNFSFPSEKVPQEEEKLARLRAYHRAVSYYAEAVAEVNDYLLTAPLLDKDPQGQILYTRPPQNQKPMPTISGLLLPDNGLTYLVDQTIGPFLRGINSLDDLAEKHLILGAIPESTQYLRGIEQHFRDNP